MRKDLPKAYVAKKYEDKIYEIWEKSNVFKPNTKSKKKPFTITMPPPNATGQLHLGHAVMLAVEDIMIRYQRMRGRPTLWIPGTDHAGIATQNKVERDLMEKEGKTRHDYGRKKFVKMIEKFVTSSRDTIRKQTRKMGASCDWSREYYSLDDRLSRTVFSTFQKMFHEGLIYRGNRIVNWCTRCYSTISDEEVDYVEKKSKFYYFQYGPFEIGTARPETKYGDHIVVVHPDDERYKKYHDKEIMIDWIDDKPIRATVVADEISDPEMGSGVMTATPAHSFVDFDLAQKYGFEISQMINEDGKMTAANGKFAGLTVEEAREEYVKILDKKGLVNRIDEDYTNNLSICSRCKTAIQPLVSKQWFIDVNHPIDSWDYKGLHLQKGKAYSLKEVMQHVIREDMIEIIPDRFNKTYFQWVDNLRDWCISRQLWWGHQIPVWYRKDDKDNIKVQEKTPGKDWVRDSDTLDTWFSAGLFTFSPLRWIDGHSDYKTYHPTQVMETGYDIIFFWVARMILMTTYMTGQIPFEKVYLHGMVRTRDGKKMSKSHPESCIDPLDIIAKFGADALRLSLFVGSTPGNDMRLYEEKIAGYRNFVNKLWNVARYIISSVEKIPVSESVPKPQTLADKWILSRLQTMVGNTTVMIDEYRFSQAAEDLYAFTWNELADWYLEISKIQKKTSVKNGESFSKNTDEILIYILRTILRLWHPFTPFVTEELWDAINPAKNKRLLISEDWPKVVKQLKNTEAKRDFELIRKSISIIRNLRSEYKVAPGKKINVILVSRKHQFLLDRNAEVIKQLACIASLIVKISGKPADNSVSKFTDGLAIYIPISGIIDKEKERSRLEKEIKRLEGYLNVVNAKLSNKQFLKQAPPDIVKSEKERSCSAKDSLEKFQEQLQDLL